MSHGGTDDPAARAAGDVPRSAAIDALRRILASDAFADARRSREFLAYVVRETLDGRGHRLKERTIARAALDKAPDFDPRSDSGVRVQATRVRAQLAAYYAGEGADDGVRIALPKGSYVPAISLTPAQIGVDQRRPPAITKGPSVAIVQFVPSNDAPAAVALAVGLTESLVHALAAFSGIRVVGPVSDDPLTTTTAEERRLGSRLDVHYVLRGGIRQIDGDVRVSVRVADAVTGDVVWAGTFDSALVAVSGFGGQDAIVREIAAVIGDFSGAILRHAPQGPGETHNPTVWAAMLKFYEGLEVSSLESTSELRALLLEAHALEPGNPLVLSMLASTESFLAMFSTEAERAELADSCEAHARAALAIDPSSGHAHLTLAVAAFTRGFVPVCLEHLNLAIELSPSDPSILYGAAWYFGMAGEWNRGVELMRESVRLNPLSPSLRYLFLAADELMSGDHAAALADGMRYPHTDEYWQPLMISLALDGLGHQNEAFAELAKAQALVPDLRETVQDARDFPQVFHAYVVPRLDDLLARAAAT